MGDIGQWCGVWVDDVIPFSKCRCINDKGSHLLLGWQVAAADNSAGQQREFERQGPPPGEHVTEFFVSGGSDRGFVFHR